MNEKAQESSLPAITVDQPGLYTIQVSGRLSEGADRRFKEMNLAVKVHRNGEVHTSISGEVEDQAALHGILAQIRDLGLPLILVLLIQPEREGVIDE